MNSIRLVIRHEYTQAIRKPAFWASIVILPLFLIIVSYISQQSKTSVEQKLKEQASKAHHVLIVDDAGIVKADVIKQSKSLQLTTSATQAESDVRQHQADAAIIYPADIAKTHKMKIIVDQKDSSPLTGTQFQDLGKSILQQSLLSQLHDSRDAQLVTATPSIQTVTYRQGQLYSFGEYVPYLILIGIYGLIILTSTNMFLLSVTEEKENRAIEIVMTAVRPARLIAGKITGLSLVALTQVLVIGGLSVASLVLVNNKLPFNLDFSQIVVHPLGLALGIFYLLSGILLMAALMVGIGSIVPTAKEAAGFVSVAMISTIAPIYFIQTILQDPTGPVAVFTSYFPLTAPEILIVRHALSALAPWEIPVSIAWMLILVGGGFYLSSQLFQRGAFSYNSRLSMRTLLKRT